MTFTIKKYNLIYDNWFCYHNSLLLGNLIAELGFEAYLVKPFIRELRKYSSVISLFTLLYRIMKKNLQLFKLITNPKQVTAIYNIACGDLSYYDNNSEIGFKYASMMSYFNANEDYLFEVAINNSVFRPIFRKESIISYIIPECLIDAYENEWIDEEELSELVIRMYRISIIAQETLDSGIDYSFKEAFDNGEFASPLVWLKKQADSAKNNHNGAYTINEELSVERLNDYYNCAVENINYYSVNVWRKLIEFEFSENPELVVLYKVLKENNYPDIQYAKVNQYFPIITAILLENKFTHGKILDYIMKASGRMGLVNMIHTYSLIGDDITAKKDIISLMKLCEMLVYPDKKTYINDKLDKILDVEVLDTVYGSKHEDWDSNSEYSIVYKQNPRISIVREKENDETFVEDWATGHPDSNAIKVEFKIVYDQRVIKTVNLVYVDGYRALLPMPDANTGCINRSDYQFSLLLEDNPKNLNDYIIRSGLTVD